MLWPLLGVLLAGCSADRPPPPRPPRAVPPPRGADARPLPDRRLVRAVAALDHLLSGRPAAKVLLVPQGGQVLLRYRDEEVLTWTLREGEPLELDQAREPLTRWARLLLTRYPLALQRGGAEAVPEALRGAFFTPDEGLLALQRLERAWQAGPRSEALLAAAVRLWALYAFHLDDPLEVADEVAAQALALWALGRAVRGAELPFEEALLWEALGYRAAALQAAQALPRDNPLRAFLADETPRLRGLALAGSPVAAYLLERRRPSLANLEPSLQRLAQLPASQLQLRLRAAQREGDALQSGLLARARLHALAARLPAERPAPPPPAPELPPLDLLRPPPELPALALPLRPAAGGLPALLLQRLRDQPAGLLGGLEDALLRGSRETPGDSAARGGGVHLYEEPLGRAWLRAEGYAALLALAAVAIGGGGGAEAADRFLNDLGSARLEHGPEPEALRLALQAERARLGTFAEQEAALYQLGQQQPPLSGAYLAGLYGRLRGAARPQQAEAAFALQRLDSRPRHLAALRWLRHTISSGNISLETNKPTLNGPTTESPYAAAINFAAF